ncbi:hypothetical protein JAAARDRAFT_176373 [Jaapia argillacea MUCL 33604]|uniref:PIN domain-like protein n=1 Tax=Jaapia argillacea MUCL 33604 TaxID=933084 RepID=A0A067PUF6_9AGAM|nr:hypothetical protein JAAARDRAFT_176373 [Jaapia argillacea MUCL 33604]
MGVLGFAPFIQKTCPEVIKTLPNRLRELRGMTVVIDGTLITQRLHFAPHSHPHRHVLGWYRLVTELRDSGVKAICVFDGKERSTAKQLEVERRRQVRRADAARAILEVQRSERLSKLTDLLQTCQDLGTSGRTEIASILRKSLSADLPSRFHHGLLVSEPSTSSQDYNFDYNPYGARDNFAESDIREVLSQSYFSEPRRPQLSDLDSPTISRGSEDEMKHPTTTEGQEASSGKGYGGIDPLTDQGDASRPQDELREAPPIQEQTREDTTSNIRLEPNQAIGETQPLSSDFGPETGGDDAQHDSDTLAERKDIGSSGCFQVPPTKFESAPIGTSQLGESIDDSLHTSGSDFDGSLETRDPLIPSFGHDGLQDDLDGLTYENLLISEVEPPITSTAFVNDEFAYSELEPSGEPSPAIPLSVLAEEITSLYQDFRQSIPVLQSLPTSSPPVQRGDSLVETSSDVKEGRDTYVMNKTQNRLTADEGRLWEALAVEASAIQPIFQDTMDGCTSPKVESDLAALVERSQFISESYQRRSNPPTTQTYDECKLILSAMGIPCVESTGPYEAEALAASMVIHGYADYVASEDTDVLVYEAPMIRNITSRGDPLTILSGAEVREVLELDRASYVDFALLLGTDFSQRIKNVGPTRALKFIRQYGSIEQVLEHETKYPPRLPPQEYLGQVELARSVFQSLPPVPEPEFLQPGEYDEEAISTVLRRFGVYESAVMYDWDFHSALAGNYFQDNPVAY